MESLPNSCGQPAALLPQLLTGQVLRKTIASKALKVNNFDASEDFSPPQSSTHHLLERQYITSEHVAYIFQKYGYSSEIGRKVFDALFDILLISGSQRSKYDPDVPAEEEEEEEEDEQQLPESKDSEKAPQRRIFLDQFIGRLGLLISCFVSVFVFIYLFLNITFAHRANSCG